MIALPFDKNNNEKEKINNGNNLYIKKIPDQWSEQELLENF